MNAAIYPIYRRLHHVTQNDMIVNIAEKKRSLLSSSQQWTLCSMSFRKEWLPVSIAIQFEVIRLAFINLSLVWQKAMNLNDQVRIGLTSGIGMLIIVLIIL